ncbi:hypothetical protein PQJ75_09905 [Rhodoplanes sp. TEM]|uniref:Uncharacterized protein n=1 Tax=Rhodoplanes tepidamans TaxID=200616 RepID=A0ABT5J7Z8_RHOTP|nr:MULTISPECIES: hypothetical protein [Rhodoplanes]MDC7785777.1 hypothetical protein [Rhodoplanes tepidamans]MDC7984044.1 hypothetical protein [Rhodoplanes sp. TEM]MDQ0354661.1 hypothetical protein [Rhodoplanes tepidamans]
MNKIVRENYPASKLPEELRPSADPDARVRVTIEAPEPAADQQSARPPTLEEIWARRQPPFRTKDEIDAQIRADRDEWDD